MMRVQAAPLLIALLLLASSALAAPITIGFTGEISRFDAGAFPDQPAVRLGSSFTGSFMIDPDTIIEVSPDAGSLGETQYRVGGLSGSLEMEGTTFSLYTYPPDSPPTRLNIGDDVFPPSLPAPVDTWYTEVNLSNGGPVIPNFSLGFTDRTATKLTSEDFFVPQSLVGWSEAGVYFFFENGARADGSFQTLFVIPEPSALILIGLGLGGLALDRRAAWRSACRPATPTTRRPGISA